MTSVEKIQDWLNLFSEKVTENKEYLNKLDTAIGDGDHGSNLTRGAAALKEKTIEKEYDKVTDLFKETGMALVSKIGGASGPLYGSAFIAMATESQNSNDVASLIAAGLDGVIKRGQAETGEKTMVDVWSPVVDALKEGNLTEEVIEDSLNNTKDMRATKGRASYLGERSIGHIDPGAQSSAYLFTALIEAGVLDE